MSDRKIKWKHFTKIRVFHYYSSIILFTIFILQKNIKILNVDNAKMFSNYLRKIVNIFSIYIRTVSKKY